MAAGILSVAAAVEGWSLFSRILLAFAGLTFAVMAMANLAAARPTNAVADDRGDSQLAIAFVLFTWTAACGVLGDRISSLLPPAEVVLAVLAAIGWVVAVWTFARALQHFAEGWRSWEVGGSWLLAVVAPQSLSILGSSIAGRTSGSAAVAVAVAFWVLGIVVYAALIGLVIRRLVRREMSLDRLTPDYWITMGALAISTVAALDLLRIAGNWHAWLLALAGATFICSALWIPLLVGVEIWQIGRRGLSFSHDILRWSTVFPLGMFSVASYELARTAGLNDLILVAQAFFWVGLTVAVLNAGSAAPAAASALRRIVYCE